MTFVTIDFELLSSNISSVCEVGMVKFVDGIEVSTFHSYIRPTSGLKRSKWAREHLTHITDEILQSSPTFIELHEPMRQYIDGAFMVCHCAPSDLHFISYLERKYGLDPIIYPGYVDTLEVVPKGCERSALDYVYHFLFCEEQSDHHQALSDARACGRILAEQWKRQSPILVHPGLYRSKADAAKPKKDTHTASPKGLDIQEGYIEDPIAFFTGKKVAVSGKLNVGNCTNVRSLIEGWGANLSKELKPTTDILIIADVVGKIKLKKAIEFQKRKKNPLVVVEFANLAHLVK